MTGIKSGLRPQFFIVFIVAILLAIPTWVSLNNATQPDSFMKTQPHIQIPKSFHADSAKDGTNLTDCTQVACIALTFDDGPNPLTTPDVLTVLEQMHVPATFFVVGSRVSGSEPILQRMHNDGDEIGNHSWNHPDLTKLNDQQVKQEVQSTQTAVVNAGVPAPILFRPPYGAIDARTENDINMPILLWNEDPEDWSASRPSQVITNVEVQARPGGIVDMHDIYHVTSQALPQIVGDLSAKGFHFVTVSDLLNLHPNSRGLYYGRL